MLHKDRPPQPTDKRQKLRAHQMTHNDYYGDELRTHRQDASLVPRPLSRGKGSTILQAIFLVFAVLACHVTSYENLN